MRGEVLTPDSVLLFANGSTAKRSTVVIPVGQAS
jgi:hypothetical protein